MRRSGVRMLADRPNAKRRKEPIIPLVLGKAYTARKGSSLRIRFGPEAIYMVTALPPIVTLSSIVQVLGPTGVSLCCASDLRPCDEVRLEDED